MVILMEAGSLVCLLILYFVMCPVFTVWRYANDEHLTFRDQISSLSNLNSSTACTITTSVVHSKHVYCNSLYYKLPKSQLSRLQQIQNSLACTVVKAPKSCHITPILRSLHWLKINECIEYKLLSYLQISQLPNLHTFITSYLFSVLIVLALHPPLLFLGHLHNPLLKYWSLVLVCFTMSLEWTPFISSSTSFWYQFL